MNKTLENIAASDASRILAENGIPADKPVTILVDESMADIAKRMREMSRARGMTDEIFYDLTKAL